MDIRHRRIQALEKARKEKAVKEKEKALEKAEKEKEKAEKEKEKAVKEKEFAENEYKRLVASGRVSMPRYRKCI